MSRWRPIGVLVLVVLALGLAFGATRDDGGTAGCEGVRAVHERASFVEQSGEIPTAEVYRDAADAIEAELLEAPPDVVDELQALADAYRALAGHFRGFDPSDESTYHVIEDNAAAVEAEQVVVERAITGLGTWLDARCR